ncbi:restriction endonuclease subunit S [Flavobacterium myungsuense]|uniref:Restriction endonuclease subunit S n=1 Tax=Flavobacterium myungsuense TaxID=651823 RepID=A0ABW3J0S1_9FLAO
MNNSYSYVKLKELCDVNQGLQIPIESRFTENAPNRYFYITVQFLKASHTNKFYVENPPSSSICNEEDILIVRTGSTGQIVTGVKGCFHNNFFKVNFNKELIHGRYLYHCLNTKEKYRDMLRRAGVTTIPDLNHFMFLDMEIPVPKKQNQIEIAKTLDILDSKIELNNRINAELEAMAKTLYDYWFVQFDFPNKNGKPYKTSGGKMVWNEELKREIPEGWEVKKLTEEMDLQYGFPFSTELFNDDGIGVPVIRIRDILNCSISNYSTEEVDDKYRINKGDIIVGMDGNFHINYWNRDNCYLNQRSLRIRSNNESISEIQARYSIEPFVQAREKNVSRTTVAHLSAKDVNDLKILKADNEFQIKANTFFNSNLEKIVSNSIQNQKLTELRDWLLPMLMNGQVKVS